MGNFRLVDEISSTKTHSSSYATACVFEVAQQKQPSRKKCFKKINLSFGTWKFLEKKQKKTLKNSDFCRFFER